MCQCSELLNLSFQQLFDPHPLLSAHITNTLDHPVVILETQLSSQAGLQLLKKKPIIEAITLESRISRSLVA